jgi:hypothetical protein
MNIFKTSFVLALFSFAINTTSSQESINITDATSTKEVIIIQEVDTLLPIQEVDTLLPTQTIQLENSLLEKPNQQKDNIIAQMNYCINSLTNIIHNKSMSVLEHESDQILNNLTIEQIIGLYEINDFRIELLDAISKFSITEEERALLRRLQSIKRDNLKWTALSNALNPTMLLTGGGAMGPQLAFQALLTAARSAVEYQTAKNEQNIEELQAMWNLRKEDLEKINETRKQALKLIFDIYNKYNLSEMDRLTEATANNFSIYISEANAAKRVRLLESNYATYKNMTYYYYHLGMAYLDIDNYDKAKENFKKYLDMYKKAPLFRYDEKSGCIALAILSNEKDMSKEDINMYINIALKNLPHNSAAIMQCAMIYLYELNEYETGLKLIRDGIDDPQASDRQLLYMAAANLLPIVKQYPDLHAEIVRLFKDGEEIELESYITFILNENKNVWDNISNLIKFDNIHSKGWYSLRNYDHLENLEIILPENIIYNANEISIYLEEHFLGYLEEHFLEEHFIEGHFLEDFYENLYIYNLKTPYTYGVDIEEIEKIDCFKANKDLKYLYFDVLVPGQTFILKKNIDYEKIRKEEWHRQSEFMLSLDDINDIIEFCQDNTPKTNSTKLSCHHNHKFKDKWYYYGAFIVLDIVDNYMKETETIKETHNDLIVKHTGIDKNYDIYHNRYQEGYYLRIVFANGINLLYKYDNCELIPYLYNFNKQNYLK